MKKISTLVCTIIFLLLAAVGFYANKYTHEFFLGLGSLYQKGVFVEQNYATALYWYTQAIKYPFNKPFHVSATSKIVLLYATGGPELEKDYEEAKKWFYCPVMDSNGQISMDSIEHCSEAHIDEVKSRRYGDAYITALKQRFDFGSSFEDIDAYMKSLKGYDSLGVTEPKENPYEVTYLYTVEDGRGYELIMFFDDKNQLVGPLGIAVGAMSIP